MQGASRDTAIALRRPRPRAISKSRGGATALALTLLCVGLAALPPAGTLAWWPEPSATDERAALFAAAAEAVTLLLGASTGLLGGVWLCRHRPQCCTSGRNRDPLTTLPSRDAFDAAIKAATSGGLQPGVSVTLALIDVDDMSRVNQAYGFEAGDDVLVRVAKNLMRTAPAGTLVVRLGSDKFAVVAPGSPMHEVHTWAQKASASVPPHTWSAGVAERIANEAPATLVRRAERALHAAKDAGRGCVRADVVQATPLLGQLMDAIADDAIDVALQPIVRPGSQTLMGFEALARWHHPAEGNISPSLFIPLAETHGLMPDLGLAVARRACLEAQALRRALGRPFLLTINVSGKQLVDERLTAQLVDLLEETGWPAGDLCVEVTESAVESSSSPAVATLRSLRSFGIKVAIDDFGTGYSTLSQLDALPADYLKLDARFTAQLTSSPRRVAVLAGLLRMCSDLDLTVIAEGVETAEQDHLLTQMGCPLAQGFRYHSPARASALHVYRQGG